MSYMVNSFTTCHVRVHLRDELPGCAVAQPNPADTLEDPPLVSLTSSGQQTIRCRPMMTLSRHASAACGDGRIDTAQYNFVETWMLPPVVRTSNGISVP